MVEIRKMLIEMKNISELMLDLAYSSVLYNLQDVAEEVVYLEERIDKLNAEVQIKAVEMAINDKNAAKAVAMIRLAYYIENIADAAVMVAKTVLDGGSVHPVLRKSFEESEVTIVMQRVSPNSILAGKTLGEIKLASETGMWVIAVRRGDRWIFGPTEHTKIMPGDVLIARGHPEGVEHFINICEGREREL